MNETPQIEALLAELGDLRNRIAELDRARRIDSLHRKWSAIAAAIVAIVAVAGLRAQGQSGAQALTCTELKVVGSDGKTRIDIDGNGSAGRITTYGSDGSRKAQLWAYSDNTGFLEVDGADGNPRVLLSSASSSAGAIQGYGALATFGNDGKRRVYIAPQPNGSGSISFYDNSGNPTKIYP